MSAIKKKKSTTSSSKKQKTYCICECDGNDGRFMVACDGCNNWFHPSCIGTTKQEVEKVKNFYCPKCREERAGGPTPSAAAAASLSTATPTSASERRALIDVGKVAKPLGDIIGDASFAEKVEAAIFEAHPPGKGDYKQQLRRVTSFLRDLTKKKHLAYRTQFKDKISRGDYTVEFLASSESPLFSVLDDSNGSDPEDDAAAAATTTATAAAAATASAEPALKKEKLDVSKCPRPDFSKCPNSEIAWNGTIQKNNKSVFGTFQVAGRLVLGSPDVVGLLPEKIEFAGRLITKKLCQYLHQLHRSKSRKFSVLRIDPAGDADVECFSSVFKYFTDRKRSGSLQALGKVTPPDEIYLLPLMPDEQPPLFLAESQDTNFCTVDFEKSAPRLFLIVVAKVEHFAKKVVEESTVKKEEKKDDNNNEEKNTEEKKVKTEEKEKEKEKKTEEEVKEDPKPTEEEEEATADVKKEDPVVEAAKDTDENSTKMMDVEKEEEKKEEENKQPEVPPPPPADTTENMEVEPKSEEKEIEEETKVTEIPVAPAAEAPAPDVTQETPASAEVPSAETTTEDEKKHEETKEEVKKD